MNILVTVGRGDLLESIHTACAVVVDDDDQVIVGADNAALPVFWRSAAKFFQALPVIESGAADGFHLTDAELAVVCASHNGAPVHVAAARSILRKAGNREDQLFCGPHAPMSEVEARALRARGEAPVRLHNNCSGKHAGMMAGCRALGMPVSGYQDLAHPYQGRLLTVMSQVTDVPRAEIGTGIDGCGAVCYRTPLVGMARAFRRFAAGALPFPHTGAGRRLLRAITAHPDLIAGQRRLCTALLEVTGGRLLAKIGAEGVYGVGVRPDPGLAAGRPAGLALKVLDGGGRAVQPALCALLRALGLLDDDEWERLRPYHDVPIDNHQGQLVGKIEARPYAGPLPRFADPALQ